MTAPPEAVRGPGRGARGRVRTAGGNSSRIPLGNSMPEFSVIDRSGGITAPRGVEPAVRQAPVSARTAVVRPGRRPRPQGPREGLGGPPLTVRKGPGNAAGNRCRDGPGAGLSSPSAAAYGGGHGTSTATARRPRRQRRRGRRRHGGICRPRRRRRRATGERPWLDNCTNAAARGDHHSGISARPDQLRGRTRHRDPLLARLNHRGPGKPEPPERRRKWGRVAAYGRKPTPGMSSDYPDGSARLSRLSPRSSCGSRGSARRPTG